MRIERINTKIQDNEIENNVDLNLLNPLFKKYKGKKGSLIPILQGAQNVYGFIPKSVFRKISEETGINLNDIFGVATFYAQFRLKPVGKHIIKVCHGTACHVQNANSITDAIQDALDVKDGETTKDGFFTLESVACLGCCSLAPVMMIGEDTFGKLTGKEAVNIVKNVKIKEMN